MPERCCDWWGTAEGVDDGQLARNLAPLLLCRGELSTGCVRVPCGRRRGADFPGRSVRAGVAG